MKKIWLMLAAVLAGFFAQNCYAGNESQGRIENRAKETLDIAIAVDYEWQITPEHLPFVQDIEKEAGVEINWRVYDKNIWHRQLALQMESGSRPDIYMNCISETDFAEYREAFMPLDELIELYAPDIARAYAKDRVLSDYSRQADGRIYGLAVRKPYRPGIWQKWMINQEWLTRLGLEMPETWEEFKDVLRAFRDEDANGNGDPGDEIPLVFHNFLSRSYLITGGMGRYCSLEGLICHNGDFLYIPTTKDWRETVSFLHELYKEGLLYEESVTMSYAELQSLGRSGEEARVGASIGWSANEIFGAGREQQYAVMEQPAAREGTVGIYDSQVYDGLTYENHCAQISSSCKNPETAMRFLNLFYREEYSVQAYYGSFETGVKREGDGTYTVLTPEPYGDEEWQRINSMVDTGLYYFSEDLESRIRPPESIAGILEKEKRLRKTVGAADGSALARSRMKEEDLITAGRILDSLENISLKALVNFLMQGVTDESWEAFQDKLYAADMETMISIYRSTGE